jgi:hypothetical protein
MRNLELTALNEEVKFYRATYSVQKSYIESVMNSFKEKYQEFMRELEFNLKDPLESLVLKFWQMKDETTGDNLKDFLTNFKQNSVKFEEIIKNFELLPQNDLINLTFEQVLLRLEDQVVDMNKNLINKVNNLTSEIDKMKELSNQGDYLFNEVLKITLESGSNESFNISKLTNNDDD